MLIGAFGGRFEDQGADRRPCAPCPRCAYLGDSEPKKLLFITGVAEGDYDEQIPKNYFQVPPAELYKQGENLEALRVCLMSLQHLHFCLLI